MSNKKNYLK